MEKKAEEFADKYGAEYWSTSSRTGENIEEVFTRISVVAFESVLMREISITASTAENGHGQLASSSSLISEWACAFIRLYKTQALSTSSYCVNV